MSIEPSESDLEFLFLSTCYGKGVSDDVVYLLYVKKIIAGLGANRSYTVSAIGKKILEDYGIEIPPTYITKLCKQLSTSYESMTFKKDQLTLRAIPPELESEIQSVQKENDKDSRLVFQTFNNHLVFNSRTTINYKEFTSLVRGHCDTLTGKKVHEVEFRKIFSIWIATVYSTKSSPDLIVALNKILFSYLLYSYYYGVKRANKKLQGIRVHFDTNLFVYFLGINGDEKQNYVNYLLEKLKATGSTVVLSAFTLEEFKSLLAKQPNDQIRVYNTSKKYERDQIFLNGEEFFKTYFSQRGINFQFDARTAVSLSDEVRNEQEAALRTYKSQFRFTADSSVSHDINLVNATGPQRKVSNIYKEAAIVVTTDILLCNWYFASLNLNGASDFSNLITLERLNMILWVENGKADDSQFLANTWMFIAESLPFFKRTNVDTLFRKFAELASTGITVPDNWRSAYLLLKDSLDVGQNVYDLTEEEFESALDKINFKALGAAAENEALKDEIGKLRDEIQSLKSSNQNKVNVTVENRIEMPAKTLKDFSFWQIFGEFLVRAGKRVGRFFVSIFLGKK